MSPQPLSHPDGVPAQDQGAGTPSPFAQAAAGGAADTLVAFGLPEALGLVGEHAAGPLGRAAIQALVPLADPVRIGTELSLVGEAIRLAEAGEPLAVAPVPELGPVLDRLRLPGSVLDGPELVDLRATLGAMRLLAGEFRRVAPRAPGLAALAGPVPDRRVERRLEDALAPDGELLDTASPALAGARRQVVTARERLVRKLEALLRGMDPQTVPPGAAVTIRGGRYVIPVRRDSRGRPAGIVLDESGSAGTLFIEPTEAIELGNALREAIAAEAREALAVLRELTELLRPHHADLAAGHALCVRADTVAARARYAHAIGAGVPEVGPSGGPLVIRSGRHPVLLARGGETVPFDLDLQPGERTLVVSGPNAGGKTVLLKSVGLFAALVQSGVVPPVGAGSRFPLVTAFFADIGDRQSIADDLSTFSGHVATLRHVLDEADAGSLVLLDELGSGTDPAEGGALAWAVLEALTRRGTLTVATTHLGALKTLAGEEPGVVNGSLEFDGATLSPTYRFSKGVPGRSYGLSIARRFGLDPAVIARATERVPVQERDLDALLREAADRERRARERELDLEAALARTAEREAALAREREAVEAREAALRRREREAERSAKAQARAYLLEARREVRPPSRPPGTARRRRPARRGGGSRRPFARPDPTSPRGPGARGRAGPRRCSSPARGSAWRGARWARSRRSATTGCSRCSPGICGWWCPPDWWRSGWRRPPRPAGRTGARPPRWSRGWRRRRWRSTCGACGWTRRRWRSWPRSTPPCWRTTRACG